MGAVAVTSGGDAEPRLLGRALRAAYHRLGPRYPWVALVLEIQLLYAVFVFSLGLLAIYIDISLAEFARLACATIFVQTLYNAFLVWVMLRLLGPVRAWLAGDHGRETSRAAWRAAALLPLDFLRSTVRYGFPLWANVIWSIYAVWDLGFPALSLPALIAGVAVTQLYGFGLLFLTTERVMRPVLEDISAQLPETERLESRGVPLRWRLLAALPALNIITGVAVAGLSSPEASGLGDLGLDVLVAVGVAFTVSLWLSAMLSTSIATPVIELREATQRVGSGDFSARVPVASTDETGQLAQSFNEMAAGLQERERLREAFGAFVDPDLAERVAREGNDLAGDEAELSMLFMDVRDFTTLSESRTPRAIVATLNELYECVVPIVTLHGGHANKFIADGMLAIFGAPDRLPDHADRAVAAALEIAKAVDDTFGGDLRIGVGVNTGTALVGTIGGGGRLDFTVIGDAVNTAARVESATRQTGDDVLITDTTRQALSSNVDGWEERSGVTLKGKTKEVRVFGWGPHQ